MRNKKYLKKIAFRKIGRLFPILSKPPEQQKGRTEFSGLTDLMQYIIDQDRIKDNKRDEGSH